ncbi:uncharacterized protein LOC106141576 [Amyelois transitella]|uniref:uncharacterized protein LOC106141576 n=1 Tax=Amyelois transitella TaxID=680683 RepID=UPI00298FB4B8|nr:uncharacterized protein LOC106141576 [Amyelois transitella]
MGRYVVILLIVERGHRRTGLDPGLFPREVVLKRVKAPPPIRVTIDCGSKERDSLGAALSDGTFTVNSFCNLIHNSIPKAIHDGRVILLDDDQDGFANTHVPISMPPPKGFVPKLELPKFRVPKLKVPTMKVPKLKQHSTMKAPIVGSAMRFPSFREEEEVTSAERMEKFKKGVRKLLHVVKVLGQIDQYLSERTRIIVDKLSKTFAE